MTLTNDTFILEAKDINIQTKVSPTPTPTITPYIFPKPFSFSISPTSLDFGEITPTDPTTRNITTRVNPGDIPRFTLFSLANHELTSENKKIIPDTTCDNGTCTIKYASLWDNILTYGFGYKISDGFMQVPNVAKGDTLSPIIFDKTETTITYKVNISTSQDIGLYTNTIQLIAVPNF